MNDVLAQIDAEIAKLQQARALLAGAPDVLPTAKAGRGRPKGSKNSPPASAPAAPTSAAKKKAKRELSPAGRKAIADAMKRRWAERRKQPAA